MCVCVCVCVCVFVCVCVCVEETSESCFWAKLHIPLCLIKVSVIQSVLFLVTCRLKAFVKQCSKNVQN